MKHLSDLPELGEEVARLRKEKGLTQRQLAALTGLTQPTLARFETGRVAEFGSRKLLRILEVLGYELACVPAGGKFTLDEALAQKQREAQAAGARP